MNDPQPTTPLWITLLQALIMAAFIATVTIYSIGLAT